MLPRQKGQWGHQTKNTMIRLRRNNRERTGKLRTASELIALRREFNDNKAFGQRLRRFFSNGSADAVLEEINEHLDISAAVEHYMEYDFDADTLDLDDKIEDKARDTARDEMGELISDHEREYNHDFDPDEYVGYDDLGSVVDEKVQEAISEHANGEIQDALETNPDLDRKLTGMVQTVVRETLDERELRQVIATVVRASVISEMNQRERNREQERAQEAAQTRSPVAKVVERAREKASAIWSIVKA